MMLQDGVARLLAIHEGRLADQVELETFAIAIATLVRFVTTHKNKCCFYRARLKGGG